MIVRKKKAAASLGSAITSLGSSSIYMLLDITNLSDQAIAAIKGTYEAFAGMPQPSDASQSNRKSVQVLRLRPDLESEDEELEDDDLEDEEGEDEEEGQEDEEQEEGEENWEEEEAVDKSQTDDYLVKKLEVDHKEMLAKGSFQKTGWNEVALKAALKALSKKHLAQKKKIFLKAVENGGQIGRAEVYAVANYKPTRSLKGFSRPVRSIMESLEEQGILPEGAEPLMSNIYDKSIRTFKPVQGFKVPLEVVSLMRKMGMVSTNASNAEADH
jgi:hypothetical protein